MLCYLQIQESNDMNVGMDKHGSTYGGSTKNNNSLLQQIYFYYILLHLILSQFLGRIFVQAY
jgi:hypothetical protein